MAPGQHVNLWVRLKGRPDDGQVTIGAQLGKASAEPVTVDFGCWHHWCGKDPLPTTTTRRTALDDGHDAVEAEAVSDEDRHTAGEDVETEPTNEPPTSTTTSSAPPRPTGKPGDQRPTATPEKGFGWLTG